MGAPRSACFGERIAMTSSGLPLLRVESLSKVYATSDGPVRALDQVSIDAQRGQFLQRRCATGKGSAGIANRD